MAQQSPPRTPSRFSVSSIEASAYLFTPGGARSTPRMQGSARSSMPTDSPGFATPDRVLNDRFIPDRDGHSNDMARFMLGSKENGTPTRPTDDIGASPQTTEPYTNALARRLFQEETQVNVLGFHRASNEAMRESSRFTNAPAVVYADNRKRQFMSRSFRVIPQTPDRILDAPELMDDFYLNLLDWSARNVLSVALGQTLYLWNADTGDIQQLMSTNASSNIITGVSWNGDGSLLSVGLSDAEVAIWDPAGSAPIRTIHDARGRVGAMSWNGNILAAGSRDSCVRFYDVRAPSCIATYRGHSQEVCGVKWNPNTNQLATGGNDNLVNIWDFNRQSVEPAPVMTLTQHVAAVKALAWNPVQQGVLATGGGTADKTLRFWNIAGDGELINVVDTKSQVCGALWNKTGTELVSSHGFSDNQLTIWKYPSLRRVTDLTGHNSRVLHLAMSPDGQTVVSAAGDETIRFWRCFAGDGTSVSATTPTKRPRPAAVQMDELDFGSGPLR